MPPAWAPLYGIWYFALAQLQPDPVALYYLNYRILALGTPILLYLLFRAYRLPRLFALLVAWFFLISVANLPLWPKPGSFALCLLLLLLIATRDLRTPTRSVLLLSVGTLLCAYVRPEYLLAAGLLFGLYLILLWRQREQVVLRVELLQVLFALVVAFGLIRLFGLAPLDRANDRTFDAFAQHYALNWAAWNQSPIDPWTEYDVVLTNSFGSASSLSEAIRANPGAIARHVATNLSAYPVVLSQTILQHFNPLLPAQAPWAASASIWLLGTCASLGVLGGLIRQWGRLRTQLYAQRLRLTIFGLLTVPAFSSALIIYPRTHYLLLQGVLLVFTAGLLLSGSPGNERRSALVCSVSAIVLVTLTPSLPTTWFATPPALYPHPNRSTVEFIRNLQITRRTTMLEDDGGYYVYLGDQFQRVGAEQKRTGMFSFLREREITLIVVSANLRQDKRYLDDPEWQALLADPGVAGFTSLAIPATDRQVLYRTSGGEGLTP